MNACKTIGVIALCLILIPGISQAALDWHIRWDDTTASNIAKVYIFNPEYTDQTFSLEIGDVAKTSDDDPNAPHLIVGQDVSLRLSPGERKIFDIIVYQDMITATPYAAASGQMYQMSEQNYRALNQNYDTSSSSRQYPVITLGITPVVRPSEQQGTRYTYRSGRGYWKIALADHDHVVEHLIRTGNHMGALHASIQQLILFYTQGSTILSNESLKVWETAFPELGAVPTQPTVPDTQCVYFITYATSNLSQQTASRKIQIGDVLGAQDSMYPNVVAAQDVNYTVLPNTQTSTQLVKAHVMAKQNPPTQQTTYVSMLKHDSQLENAIRIGQAENYSACAIQDVVLYLNHQVSSLKDGQALWNRLNSKTESTRPSQRTLCFGGSSQSLSNPYSQVAPSTNTMKNLAVLVGAVVPVSVLFRRKRRK